MKIIINNTSGKYLETISIENLDKIQETFKKFSSIKDPLEAQIFAINESISSNELAKFKSAIDKINNFYLCIYSNDRETIVSGKSLKIDSIFTKEKEVKKNYSCSIQKRKKISFMKEQ